MVIVSYLDTSAAMKLLVDEAESEALLADIEEHDRRLVASWLLHTELHCAAGRHPDLVDLDAISTVLDVVDLMDVSRGDLVAAGTHAPLRSNDAIHLAAAIRSGADDVLTYDAELRMAAERAGIHVVTPGVPETETR